MIRQDIEKASFRLGDMMVVGMPVPKLVKALAVLAEGLHQYYELVPAMKPGHSKISCILCSLTARDFLFRIGFTDAEVTPVMFAIRAHKGEQFLHSLGIGDPDLKLSRREVEKGKRATGWPGHLVVKLPRQGYLIDLTLYQAFRQHWPELTGMMAVPLIESGPDDRFYGMPPISGLMIEEGDRTVDILWLDQPKNKFWRDAPDAMSKRRRVAVVDALVQMFGKWEDKAP